MCVQGAPPARAISSLRPHFFGFVFPVFDCSITCVSPRRCLRFQGLFLLREDAAVGPPCRRHELQFPSTAGVFPSPVIRAPLPSPCCVGLLPRWAFPGTHCPRSRQPMGLANSVLAWLWLAQSQLKRSLYASHFLSFGTLISTRFCQLSSRKTTPPCHEPQLARCHVGLRLLLPGPAPGAT